MSSENQITRFNFIHSFGMRTFRPRTIRPRTVRPMDCSSQICTKMLFNCLLEAGLMK